MLFVETHVFTRLVCEYLSDDQYRQLQVTLVLRPEQGPIIAGSLGLRKIRWSVTGAGKRGALRVIYFWDRPTSRCYMLYLYRKSDQGDLTKAQLRTLVRLVREEFK